MSDQQTRAFEMTIEIAVPPDVVWHALADAQELVRWFPTHAEVTPGAGGVVAISWEDQWSGSTGIEIWEPGRRLRLVDRAGRPYDINGRPVAESVAPMEIAIDWHLEAKGGSTVVRLVHSGFGSGGAWDDEYDSAAVGWRMELRGLRHYLERHRGRDRRISWTRTGVAAAPHAVFERLVGPGGVFPYANLNALREGDRYEATLATGDHVAGRVLLALPGRGVQVTIDGLNDALFRLWVDPAGTETAVNAWLSAYEVPQADVTAFGARVKREVLRALAPAVA